MVQGFRQLADSGVNLSTWYGSRTNSAPTEYHGMGREKAGRPALHDVLDTSFNCNRVRWVKYLNLKRHLLNEVLVNVGIRKQTQI
jgi:hypothetical protein